MSLLRAIIFHGRFHLRFCAISGVMKPFKMMNCFSVSYCSLWKNSRVTRRKSSRSRLRSCDLEDKVAVRQGYGLKVSLGWTRRTHVGLGVGARVIIGNRGSRELKNERIVVESDQTRRVFAPAVRRIELLPLPAG